MLTKKRLLTNKLLGKKKRCTERVIPSYKNFTLDFSQRYAKNYYHHDPHFFQNSFFQLYLNLFSVYFSIFFFLLCIDKISKMCIATEILYIVVHRMPVSRKITAFFPYPPPPFFLPQSPKKKKTQIQEKKGKYTKGAYLLVFFLVKGRKYCVEERKRGRERNKRP